MTGSSPHPLLDHAKVRIDIFGRRFEATFPPTPNLIHEFSWDGRDAYGREVTGAVGYRATVLHY